MWTECARPAVGAVEEDECAKRGASSCEIGGGSIHSVLPVSQVQATNLGCKLVGWAEYGKRGLVQTSRFGGNVSQRFLVVRRYEIPAPATLQT
ncbi:hexokinase-1 [Pseudozyma hubeiensis SY62]|uniref:Hexokinase-1 n=1 Tax=Pseudozyma hubeiensis (strain SY62) TaxID=1305764 RepID=R9PAV4_PSEHS|nr:hexokinase-1 [Pseudozyma hubeiensis SY62]GAC95215.1 hexokinase-1 [Pseudozyma hubeiensis SY62]